MSISQAKLKGNLGAIADYFLDVDADLGDYYLAEDGTPETARPRARGGLAERLGLTGEVTAEQLLRLLDGRHPITGHRLLEYRKDRVAGVDQTASAPKSVSVVWAVGAPEERHAVERAQDSAVDTLVDYMRRRCPLVRDHGEPQLAKDVLAVAVNHHTSRQTEEQATRGTAPDPQLHTHLLWLLAERQDGRLCAVYRDQIWKNRIEWEAAYHCALATELARAGFPLQRMTGKGGRYFEIAGIPDKLRTRWSGRSVEVTEAMEAAAARFRERYGREPSVVELRREVVKSRRRKLLAHKIDLRHYWRSIAELDQITPAALALLRRSGGPPSEAEARDIVTRELLGLDGLTKHDATFTGRDLRVAALRHGAGLLDVAQVEHLVLDLQRSGDLVLTGEDRWTTRRMWAMERRVLGWYEDRLMAEVVEAPGAGIPTQDRLLHTVVRSAKGDRVRLSVEQLEVLREMLGNRTSAVTGWAGSGKGVVARAAGDVWRSEGRRITALALAGLRAAELAAELGEGTEHMSVDQFLHHAKAGRIRVRDTDVIVIDEASQIRTEQWVGLANLIETTGRLVMLGDSQQLSSIGAGSMWPLLSRGAPELTEVFRTKLRWERDAWSALRHGRAAEALAAYAEHRRLRLSPTRAESLERAVRDWARDGRNGLLITDASNAERDWLNQAAQQHRILAGDLGTEHVTVTRPHGSVRLHRGDRVLFHAAHRPYGERRIENGTAATVQSVDPVRGTLTVETAEASRRHIELRAEDAPLELHYATHVYKAQGATVDRAYVITGGWQTSQESLYVACSRSREGTRLYLDKESLRTDLDADAIALAAARGAASRAKVSAIAHAHASGTADDRYARAANRLRGVHRDHGRQQRPDTRHLTLRYRLRKARQDALRRGRLRSAAAALQRRYGQDPPRPTLETVAALQGVPAWALEAAEVVTGRSYVAEHVASASSARSLVA